MNAARFPTQSRSAGILRKRSIPSPFSSKAILSYISKRNRRKKKREEEEEK